MTALAALKPRPGTCSICEAPQTLVGLCKATGLAFGKCCAADMGYASWIIDNHALRFGMRHPQVGDTFGQETI
jgi:hypothetical protein